MSQCGGVFLLLPDTPVIILFQGNALQSGTVIGIKLVPAESQGRIDLALEPFDLVAECLVQDEGMAFSRHPGTAAVVDGKTVFPNMKLSKEKCDQVNAIERDKALAWVERNIKVPLTEPQKAGIASFCPYNIGPGKCFPSTFYKRLNAGDRKGACEAIRWWIKDGGRDCRIRSNNCYGQVIRRDQESALTCWGIEQ